MKIKLTFERCFGLLIIGYVIYIIIISLLGISNPFWTAAPNSYPYSNDLKPFDAVIPDSISDKNYKYLTDSIAIIRKLKNGDNFGGSGVNFSNLLATGEDISCDTCSLSWYRKNDDNNAHIQRYIKLPGWGLKIRKNLRESNDSVQFSWDIDSVQFYVNRGQAFVRKITINPWQTPKKNPIKYHLVDEPVKFRYNQREQCLMIPVTSSVKSTLEVVLDITGFIVIIYLLYLLSGFLHFILDLSKGLSFTDRNVKRLRVIYLSLLLIPVSKFSINLLLKLVFHSYFTTDVILNGEIWESTWKTLVLGIVFYMLYKAFKQGKKLKEEQELTI